MKSFWYKILQEFLASGITGVSSPAHSLFSKLYYYSALVVYQTEGLELLINVQGIKVTVLINFYIFKSCLYSD